MAFHPFRWFRKHQKGFFAFMLIVCMITFVFSFGAADPIQSALRWIGATGNRGEPVLPLYGKTIYTNDLDKIKMRRQLANGFLAFGIVGAPPLDNALNDIRKRLDSEKKAGTESLNNNPVQSALREFENLRQQMSQFPAEMRYFVVAGALKNVQQLLDRPEVRKNPDQARDIDTIATVLAFDAWSMDPRKQPQEYYFGGTPQVEDLLDFAVWKHQADKLGIVLTAADVSREVNRAWGNGDPAALKPDGPFDRNDLVAKYMSANKVHKDLTSRDLLGALTDEFRVAIAKEAILGTGSGVRKYRGDSDGIHHSPTVATPDEFLKYFQEQRTTLAVNMLRIPVESFVPKVELKPTEADLRNLYERYKEDEPSPLRRQPAFKEPRRVKVQYFSYRPDSPFGKKLAAKATELLPLFRLGRAASTFTAGGGAAWAAALAVPDDIDHAIRSLYEEYRKEEENRALKFDRMDDSFGRFGYGFDVLDGRGAELRPSIAFLSQVLGAAGTGGTMLTAPVAWISTYELDERATATVVASNVLAGASSSPFVAATLPTRYLHTAQPMEAVRARLVERFETNLAQQAMQSNLLNVRKELDKVLNTHSEQKLDEFVKKAVADYGLENFHSMTVPQSFQDILDKPDPALKELQTAYDNMKREGNPFLVYGEQQRPIFALGMFHTFDLSPQEREQERQRQELASRFKVQLPKVERPIRSMQFHSDSGEQAWVFWRAEDKPAYVPKYADIRAQVDKAWRYEQARKLARKDADRIVADLKKQDGNASDAVRFLRDQKPGDVFEMTNIAHLRPPAFLAGRKIAPRDFTPYRPDKKDIAFPPADFVDQLLKLKKPGEATVLADQPVHYFYVAVLMEKPQVPDRREFYEIYSFTGSDNPLWTKMMNDRHQSFDRKLMEQLRAEATKSLENGEYIIPESARKRESSSDSGE